MPVDPHFVGLTFNGRTAQRLAGGERRLAVLERSGGGVGGSGGASTFTNEVTGTAVGASAALTINTAGTPQMARLGIGQAAAAAGTPLAITSTANADVTMTSAAASRSRHVFGETGLGNQWWAGKGTGNSFQIQRSSATSGNGSAQLNLTAIEVGSTIGAADIYLWNKTKVWAVPNLLYGNAALEIGTKMSGDTAGAGVTNYRLSCSVSGYKDGSNGERDGIPDNDAIATDAVAGVDAASSYYFPYNASNIIRGVGVGGELNPTHPDKGSAHQFVCFWDVQEPVNMDAYCEVYTFASVHNLARRGVLASGCEQQMNIAAGPGTYGHAGPARASGWCLIIEDQNPYSAYADTANEIFQPGSSWRQTAARGLWVHAKGQRGGTGIHIDGRHVEATGDTAEWQRAIVVNVASDNGVAGTDVWMVDGWGNMGLGVTSNQTQNVTGLPARITFGNTTTSAGGVMFGATQNPTTLYRVNSSGRLRLENLTGNCEVEINPEAAGRGRFIFSDATTQKWSMGKEADNAFAIGRIGSNPPPTGMTGGNAILVGDLATGADVSIYNKVKIWATTANTTFGNAALDAGTTAFSGDPAVVVGPSPDYERRAYRISAGALSFTGGSNGTRGDAINTDAACVGTTGADTTGASFYFPYLSPNIVTGTDKGSLNTYLSAITLNEPATDIYFEAYSFTSLITCNRRGALVSGGEMQMNVGGVGAGKGGPARASGLALICNEANTYASYASSTIFGAGSPWQSTGLRGQWVQSVGTQRGGTGIFIAGSHAWAQTDTRDWERALVVNVGSGPNVNGTDVLCIDGLGNLGLGVTNDQAGSIGARVHFKDSTIAYGGIRFGTTGMIDVYRSAASALAIDISNTAGGLVNVLIPTTLTAAQSGILAASGQTIAMNAGAGVRAFSVAGTYTLTGEPNAVAFIGFAFNPTITLSSSGTPTTNDLNENRGFGTGGSVNLVASTTYGNISAAGEPWSEFRAATSFLAGASATANMLGGYTAFNAAAHVINAGYTLTTHRGLWAQCPVGASGATITTMVGVDVEDLDLWVTRDSATLTNTPISLRSVGLVPEMRHGGPAKIGSAGATAGSDHLAPTLELERTRTITGAVTDGFVAALALDPAYDAATAQTVTRHNYIDIQDVALTGAGPATVTDACVFRFDAAIGTHKAVAAGTTKVTPSIVTAWVKTNINGVLHYIPAYASQTT